MKTEILLGDEAVALGAVHAGLTGAYSYPGTPASEIMEYLIKLRDRFPGLKASWSVNEKVAYEEALGVSFAGRRAMVSMKHVGLNVAADPFMNSAITGTNGGLVVVAADDPGMHSSQNEQDSRYYARFARIPCFEPSTHQEAYDMAREAFDISEAHGVPVMIRLVTRLSHSRSLVKPREPRGENEIRYGAAEDWTLLPSNARRGSNGCSISRTSSSGCPRIRRSTRWRSIRGTAPWASSPRASPITMSRRISTTSARFPPFSKSACTPSPSHWSGSSSSTSTRCSSSRKATPSSRSS